jgi:hypothetical protein
MTLAQAMDNLARLVGAGAFDSEKHSLSHLLDRFAVNPSSALEAWQKRGVIGDFGKWFFLQ